MASPPYWRVLCGGAGGSGTPGTGDPSRAGPAVSPQLTPSPDRRAGHDTPHPPPPRQQGTPESGGARGWLGSRSSSSSLPHFGDERRGRAVLHCGDFPVPNSEHMASLKAAVGLGRGRPSTPLPSRAGCPRRGQRQRPTEQGQGQRCGAGGQRWQPRPWGLCPCTCGGGKRVAGGGGARTCPWGWAAVGHGRASAQSLPHATGGTGAPCETRGCSGGGGGGECRAHGGR